MFLRLEPAIIAIALIGFVMPATRGIAKDYSNHSQQERRIERGSRIVVRNEFGDISIAGSDRNTVEAVATNLNRSEAVPVSISEAASGNQKIFTLRSEEH